MLSRTEIKELAAGRADSAIATASNEDEVPREVGEEDYRVLAGALDASPDELEGMEVDDDQDPTGVKKIFRRAYKRRLRQEFGEGYGP